MNQTVWIEPILFAIFHFNIIISNMSTCSFHCSILHYAPHTKHHLCMSQFSPPSQLLSFCFVSTKQKHCCTVLCTEGASVTVRLSFLLRRQLMVVKRRVNLIGGKLCACVQSVYRTLFIKCTVNMWFCAVQTASSYIL